MDGSTDASVSEKELIYVLFLNNRSPKIKYLSVEDIKTADTIGLQDSIEQAFKRIGISSLIDHLVGLNCDWASLNMGDYHGLATRIKELAPWLESMHCFNHRMELAFKDAFEKIPAFQKIEKFLLQLYYLYEKSPKQLRPLHELSSIYQ